MNDDDVCTQWNQPLTTDKPVEWHHWDQIQTLLIHSDMYHVTGLRMRFVYVVFSICGKDHEWSHVAHALQYKHTLEDAHIASMTRKPATAHAPHSFHIYVHRNKMAKYNLLKQAQQ